jgi:dienelactone hydrolase
LAGVVARTRRSRLLSNAILWQTFSDAPWSIGGHGGCCEHGLSSTQLQDFVPGVNCPTTMRVEVAETRWRTLTYLESSLPLPTTLASACTITCFSAPRTHDFNRCGLRRVIRERSRYAHRNKRLRTLALVVTVGCIAPRVASGQERIALQATDGWVIAADRYGSGPLGLVLVHGGRLTKDSWSKQAAYFVSAGYHVIALDLRGFGNSQAPPASTASDEHTALDVIAAVRYLRAHGATTISLIGGSMGGDAAADASWADHDTNIDRVVLLSSAGGQAPNRILAHHVLVIAARDDQRSNGERRFPGIQAGYDKIAVRKSLNVLNGTAHGQAMFGAPGGETLLESILRFLRAP